MGENIEVESKPETTPTTETTVTSNQIATCQFSQGLQVQASFGPRLQEKMSEKMSLKKPKIKTLE